MLPKLTTLQSLLSHVVDSTDDCPAGAGGCAAGSTCIDGINVFSCNCQAGYDGELCDNDIDECAM